MFPAAKPEESKPRTLWILRLLVFQQSPNPVDFQLRDALVGGVKAIPVSDLGEPFYEGSVQRLYAVPGDDSIMVTQTSSRGSVFDVGALFEIEGHDINRALFRHLLY